MRRRGPETLQVFKYQLKTKVCTKIQSAKILSQYPSDRNIAWHGVEIILEAEKIYSPDDPFGGDKDDYHM